MLILAKAQKGEKHFIFAMNQVWFEQVYKKTDGFPKEIEKYNECHLTVGYWEAGMNEKYIF